MRNLAARSLLVSAALAAAACNTDAPNPFVPQARTTTLPADARLLFTSDAWTTRPGAPREVFAARADGGGVQRVTFCNSDERACDTVDAAASPDRRRLVMRRVLSDTNGDGSVREPDDAGLVAVDLQRGLEATIVPPTAKVSGVDWSPRDELVLFTAAGMGGDDLFGIQGNGSGGSTIISTSGISERRPRFNAAASAALYERTGADGLTVIWMVSASAVPATLGGTAGAPLPGTPYLVGSDADAAYAPDGQRFVFRRLTSTGLPPYGTWDLLTMGFDGATPVVIAGGGSVFRGAPDWGPEGIVFPEFDGSQWRLVLVEPGGSNRRVLVTPAAGQRITSVRWLR